MGSRRTGGDPGLWDAHAGVGPQHSRSRALNLGSSRDFAQDTFSQEMGEILLPHAELWCGLADAHHVCNADLTHSSPSRTSSRPFQAAEEPPDPDWPPGLHLLC